MRLPSVMHHDFARIPRANIPRSSFNRSHGHKTTFNSGYLVPFYVDEVLPADTFSLSAALFARMATPIVPIMDNLFLETFFFFVPSRLLWDNWQRFHGEQDNPGDSTDFMVPQLVAPEGGFAEDSIADHFGIPPLVPGLSVNALFFRAYNFIYNEWFRDQNLQDSVPFSKGDGPDNPDDYVLLRRGKRHDYFTSCLPWPQKGPGVDLPLGGSAPVTIPGGQQITSQVGNFTGSPTRTVFSNQDNTYSYPLRNFAVEGSASPIVWSLNGTSAPNQTDLYYPPGQLSNLTGLAVVPPITGTVDLSAASAASINSLRQAFQLQKLLERDARGGTRYTEIIRSHFGVVSPDSRLQRPEYLGGSSTRINTIPVQQTSSTDSTTPQGNLAAYGVAGDKFHGFTKSFVEHGVILGFVNVRADLTYQQGIPRMFSRKTRYDYYYPVLSHLGEQAVLNKEIYATGNAAQDDAVFGYQERWGEYRFYQPIISGKFRSTVPQPLDVWHLSQKFENLPALNAEFIQDHPPISRVIAVQDEPEFILDTYINLKCARPMPVYSVPGLIDHF